MKQRLMLGLDSSTQSLSAVLIDPAARQVVYETAVNFDADLPHYGTRNGVLRSDDPTVVHAPPLMWVEALDLLFERLRAAGVPLGAVAAVAGSGQQHGSVYLDAAFPRQLAGLDPRQPLAEQLRAVLTRATAPVWMDSSTAAQCAEIEAALGGRRAVAEATGSAAFERFTGPQIRKFMQESPADYERTAHVALVSSFMASVLAGRVAPIDPGDGAGMNLMDIRSCTWLTAALEATAPGLAGRLPPVAPSWTVIGAVSRYFVSRYGLAADAQAVVWSGDNPNSLIGLGLVRPGWTAISLGTSDTLFGAMEVCRTDPRGEGHVFGSPAGGYLSLICFKNGSLARERVKDACGLDWPGFEAALRDTPPGNGGALMLPWFEPEIVPRVLRPGERRRGLTPDDAAASCRAVVEGQMLAMRLHAAWMGERPTRIYATGGASRNNAILQVMADVQQCPVYRFRVGNSAALGAALRAWQAVELAGGTPVPWEEIVAGFAEPDAAGCVRPRAETEGVYTRALEQYAAFERDELAKEGA
jgi:xylulokinase